jgi:DhnA family fructose-bisphosphate aldolase class Ia
MAFSKKKRRMKKLIHRTGKTLLVAFDHGFEHGPAAYGKTNMDPVRIAKIAMEGFADGVIVHAGAAKQIRKLLPRQMGMVVKVTGKTNLTSNNIQSIVTSVKEAKKLGADAIAATIHVGAEHEYLMLQHISKIKLECMKYKLPLIGFMYPRVKGKAKDDLNSVRYAARVGAELGLDMVKTYYTGDKDDFRKVVDDCFVPLVCGGGPAEDEGKFLKKVDDIMDSGANGLAVGRNVWTNEHPGLILGKIHNMIHRSGNSGTKHHH